jgi:hypothetical protein
VPSNPPSWLPGFLAWWAQGTQDRHQASQDEDPKVSGRHSLHVWSPRSLPQEPRHVGETHHGGKWFKGEQDAILDRQTFEQVQALLESNRIIRRVKHSKSNALLQDNLFDDNGNLMSPTFSSKNGVRYGYYVSRALRGQKHKAGSVTRIAAQENDSIAERAFKNRFDCDEVSRGQLQEQIEKVTLKKSTVRFQFSNGTNKPVTIDVSRPSGPMHESKVIPTRSGREPDQKLLQAIVRANIWLSDLASGRYGSVEDLARAMQLHPKVVRQGLRLAFLAPMTTEAILDGAQLTNLTLRAVPKNLPLRWSSH